MLLTNKKINAILQPKSRQRNLILSWILLRRYLQCSTITWMNSKKETKSTGFRPWLTLRFRARDNQGGTSAARLAARKRAVFGDRAKQSVLTAAAKRRWDRKESGIYPPRGQERLYPPRKVKRHLPAARKSAALLPQRMKISFQGGFQMVYDKLNELEEINEIYGVSPLAYVVLNCAGW